MQKYFRRDYQVASILSLGIGRIIAKETHAIAKPLAKVNATALVLFDFAAAFPSIARELIWIALKSIGIPDNIILVMQGLYMNNIYIV